MKPKVLIPIAQGTEEMEMVTLADILVRGGAQVVVASVETQVQVVASRGLKLTADFLLQDALESSWDLILLPGGTEGAERLSESADLVGLLQGQLQSGRLVGAICAVPALVLAKHGLLTGYQATCYPSFQAQLPEGCYVDAKVVSSRNLHTSQGPATALMFGLKCVALLFGAERADEVGKGMLVGA